VDLKGYKSYKDYKNYNRPENHQGYPQETASKASGYKSLPFFQQSEIIYDFTVGFCHSYIDLQSRTKDQMEQAARSGKQNIAEGYLQKSLESRIKLLAVARGSLEELLNDYLDFLRQRNLPLWPKDSPEAQKVRSLGYKNYKSYNDYKDYLNSPVSAANAMICLINQTNSLLDQKLRWTEEKFIKEGGFRENLLKKRLAYREKNPNPKPKL
jgi:four helix bundle suffix protein